MEEKAVAWVNHSPTKHPFKAFPHAPGGTQGDNTLASKMLKTYHALHSRSFFTHFLFSFCIRPRHKQICLLKADLQRYPTDLSRIFHTVPSHGEEVVSLLQDWQVTHSFVFLSNGSDEATFSCSSSCWQTEPKHWVESRWVIKKKTRECESHPIY